MSNLKFDIKYIVLASLVCCFYFGENVQYFI